MKLLINFKGRSFGGRKNDIETCLCRLLLLVFIVATTATTLINCHEGKDKDEESLIRQILENDEKEDASEMSPQQLSDMMEKFGQEIGGMMSENIDRMLDEEKKRNKKQANDDDAGELERIRRTNEMVARDAEIRIGAAGRASTGELAEFSLSDAYASGKDFFVNKVNTRLQQAGSYIGSQMSSMATMAPSLKEKLRKTPSALRKILSWPTFFNFKVKFNKVYKSRMAELYHQMVFLKTQTITGIHNMRFFFGRTRYLQKTTQYADLTEEEYLDQTGNDSDGRLDDSDGQLSKEQSAKLEELEKMGKNIYGGDMNELLEKSKETSPAELLAKKRAAKAEKLHRRKRELDDDDDEDEEGPMYSVNAFESAKKDAGESEDDDGDDDEYEEVEVEVEVDDEDTGGNREAVAVDDFATGFQNVDLEAQMDSELQEEDDQAEGYDNFKPIDWSQHRCMPIIENQENCGFCYALVAATMSDFYICMSNLEVNPDTRPRRLSGRFVSDCGRYLYKPGQESLIEGCRGGIIGQAIKFIREAGAMSFFGYEIQRVANKATNFTLDECVLPRPPTIKDWAPIRANYLQNSNLVGVARDDWSRVNLSLHAAGPVMVNIRPWIGFKNYAGGIFDEIQVLPERGKVHSMLIVGRDRDENGHIYYKLRNTHGTPWGEMGYIRISSKALEHYSTIKGVLMPMDLQ